VGAGKAQAATLTGISMAETLGSTGSVIVSIATALFAYSTLIGWNYYGEKAIEYLLGEKSIKIYRVFFVVAVMVGSVVSLKLALDFSDLMNALMAIPNLIGLLWLSPIIKLETERYFSSLKK
jgi:AGCS family alanine or glycine:cation symporter